MAGSGAQSEEAGESATRVLRFGVVGVLNTLIDFGVLNLLMLLLGVVGGLPLVLCNVAAFLTASVHSYLLNKGWTFRDRSAGTLAKFLQFLGFSFGGLVVNSGVLYLLTAGLAPAEYGSSLAWTNIAKAAATLASMTWNYLAYRMVVFRAGGGCAGRGRRVGIEGRG